jgi:NADH-quinone oxidoreductase subunit A
MKREFRKKPARIVTVSFRNRAKTDRVDGCDPEPAGLKRRHTSRLEFSLGKRRRRLPADPVVPDRRPRSLRGLRRAAHAVARLTGAHKPDPAKLSEYECGFPAFEDARAEFDVRFYLVAILFIVFDLEAAFLFPWAVSLDFTRWSGWVAMMIFLIELGLGLAYAWKKGALEWE